MSVQDNPVELRGRDLDENLREISTGYEDEVYPEILPNLRTSGEVTIDSYDIYRFMDEFGDQQLFHDVYGLGSHLDFLDGVKEGRVVVPGTLPVYNAIRTAEKPVEGVEAEFRKPINNIGVVDTESSVQGDTEELKVRRMKEGEADERWKTAVKIHLHYTEEDQEDLPAKEINRVNAYRLASTLGLHPQEGNILHQMNADFSMQNDLGRRKTQREHLGTEELDDRGYNRSNYRYRINGDAEDVVDVELLEIDPEVLKQAIEEYSESVDSHEGVIREPREVEEDLEKLARHLESEEENEVRAE